MGILELCCAAVSTYFTYSENFVLLVCKNINNNLELEDFYTMFYDPIGDNKELMNCTSEAVYPLYSMVMTFLAYCLVYLFLFRLPVIIFSNPADEKNQMQAFYYVMKWLPVFAVGFSVLVGLFYKFFPY